MIEEILGSRTKVRILRLLFAHPVREFTTRELARAVGQSLGSVHPSLAQLLATRVILTRRVGRSRTVRLNRTHPLSERVAALFRAETSSLADLGRAFAHALPKPGIEAVVLFGSVARGEATARSDVDVLVVVDRPARAAAVRDTAATMLDRHDVNISPLVLTSKEVMRRLGAFDPLLETIAAEGRRLRGRATWLGR